jgi:hypothetical protein
MKIGDKVQLGYSFRITDIQKYSLVISIDSPGGPFHTFVPKYLNGFGLRLPGFNFIFPGELLDVEHPDYYKKSHIDSNRKAVYLDRYNRKVRIKLDADSFYRTGEYLIENLDNSGTITKFARQKSEAQIQDELDTWAMQENIPGSVIAGIVVDIRYCEAHGANKDGDELKSTTSLEDAKLSHAADNPEIPYILITVKDELSNIEFSLPANTLKLMS